MMRRIFALFLAPALLLAGCAQTSSAASGEAQRGNGGAAKVMKTALAEPAYPELPYLPAEPEEGNWDKYLEEREAYYAALEELRGEGIETDALTAMTRFSAKSAAIAMAGQKGKNVVYSPVSLWCALALAARCAEGESRAQVLEALGAADVEELQKQVDQVWRSLYGGQEGATLLLANSIWLNSALEGAYVRETLDDLSKGYYAGAYAAPMGSPEADREVTAWISDNTGGLIGSDGEPVVDTTPEELALLISTLYYKAGWTSAFQEEATQEDTFTDAAGEEKRVDFMHRTGSGSFLRRDGYQAAALATQLGEMVFILPDEDVTPEALLRDPELLSKLDLNGEDARFGEVQWSVPRFDVDSDLDLTNTLPALGIRDLLDPGKADLSALTDIAAYLSEARQLARVKVDEKGVEAAAATILSFRCTSLRVPVDQEVCVMDLDRPFLFLVRYQGVPLFVGIVNQI